MLRSIRETTGSWIVKIFLGLLALSFGVWGIEDVFRGSSNPTVASVGSTDITASEFSVAYQREFQRLSTRLGGRLDQEQARELGLPESTLQQLIGRALLRQAAGDYGLTVSDAYVVDEIQQNPGFRNSLGQFDKLVFDRAISNAGFNEAAYVAALRNDLTEEQLLGSVAGGLSAPEVLADRLYAYRAERRIADLVIVPSASVSVATQPTEEDLRRYYDENVAEFTAPEYRSLSYFVLSPEEMARNLEIEAAALQSAYQNRIEEFTVPERRHVEQLLFSSEDAAKAAKDRIDQGGDFIEVGKTSGSMTADNPDLGTITRARLPSEVADDVFAMAEGGVSPPLRSPFGWHVFRVTGVEPGRVRPLDEVRDDLRQDVAFGRASEEVYELAERIEDAFAGGTNLSETAQRLGLPVKTVAALDAQGRGADGKPVEGLPEDPRFLDNVFTAAVGEEPILHDIDSNQFYAFQLGAVTPSALRPFDQVKDDVRRAWQSKARDTATRDKADKLAAEIAAGRPLPAADSEGGLRTKVSPPVSRFDLRADPEISLDLLTRLFTLSVGQTAVAAAPSGEGYVIARLTEIVPAGGESRDDERAQFVRSLQQSLESDLAQAFRAALTERYGVDIDREALQSTF